MLTTPLNLSLAKGLAAVGQAGEAIALVDGALARVAANGDQLYLPELLRLKGGLLLQMPDGDPGEADACLVQALASVRRQGARAWQLRIAIDLARRAADRGDRHTARGLLQPVYDGYVEGLDTADLRTAARMLNSLRERSARHERPSRRTGADD